MDNISDLISRIEGTTSKEARLCEDFENTFILANPQDSSLADMDLLRTMLNDLCKNKIADAILYSRLSQRLLLMADDMEDQVSENDDAEHEDDDIVHDFEYVSETLDEHSIEEFEFFKDILSLSMTLKLACQMDFSTNPDAASMKFQSFEEMIDFVQMREMKSIFKFYMLWQAIVSTPIFADLSDDTYVYFVSIVKDIIIQELEHFDDLKEYSCIGTDDFTQSKLSLIRGHMDKEI